ncbi:MAG: hypothetical protein KJ042_12575 [Deltaproteobacteria bacterium]|nr:hypothetical protein [Deltaproteobacteria bacterium]
MPIPNARSTTLRARRERVLAHRIAVSIVVAILWASALASSAFAADEVLCVVLDSQPEVLDKGTYTAIHKGLCGTKAVEPGDKERDDVRSLILFAIASGNMKTVDMILETHGAARLLYSLHSASDGLLTHSVFAYDPQRAFTALGGRTWDRDKKPINGNETFAREAGRFALNQLAARSAIDELSMKGGRLGVEIASIVGHVSEPTQFLRARVGANAAERAAVEAILKNEKLVWPGPCRELAWCAFHLLTGDEKSAIAACDRWAKAGPRTLADITRANLYLATHRYKEALASADAADRALGFDLFLLSRSWALAGLGRDKDAGTVFSAFVNRNGAAWEKAVLGIAAAAHAAGDMRNRDALAALAIGAGISADGRAVLESLGVAKVHSTPKSSAESVK